MFGLRGLEFTDVMYWDCNGVAESLPTGPSLHSLNQTLLQGTVWLKWRGGRRVEGIPNKGCIRNITQNPKP